MLNRALAAAATGALLLSACGGSDFADLSLDEMEKETLAAMLSLDSVTVDTSSEAGGSRTTFKVSLTKAGDCSGTLSRDGGTAEFLTVGGEVYFKANDAFATAILGIKDLTALEQYKAVVGDSWVTGVPNLDFSSLCDLDDFLKNFEKDAADEADGGKTTKGDVEEIDGVEAVVVTTVEKNGEINKGWVATEGEHYLLKTVTTKDDESSTTLMTDFNAEFDIVAPADDEVVDVSSVG